MSYNAQSARYLESEVMSRSQEWLIPLLYEHLLAGLHRASVQIANGDIEGKAISLERANTILLELVAALDHEQGGPLARHLSALYAFFVGELLTVGRTLDTARLGRLISMIGELHEGWVEAAESIAPRNRGAAPLAIAV